MKSDSNFDCDAVIGRRAEIAADELSGVERAAVDAHVAECAACRARLGADQDLLRLLDLWETPAMTALPTMAPPSPSIGYEPRRSPWRAAAIGAATAATLFVALVLGGTRIEKEHGQLTISFGRTRPMVRPVGTLGPAGEPDMERLAVTLASVLERQDAYQAALVEAVDDRHARQRDQVTSSLVLMIHRLENEQRDLRRALVNLAQHTLEQTPATLRPVSGPGARKEIR